MSSSTLTPTGPGGRSRGLTVALVALAAIAVFGAGIGISLLIRGSGSTTPNGTAPPGPTCTPSTVIPAQSLPKPGTVSINVFNATNRQGLASRSASVLKVRGFVVGKIANDPLAKTVTGTGELRYGPAGIKNAQLLLFYLPKAKLVKDGRTDGSVDVVLGNTFTAIPAQDAVTKALNTPVTVQTGPGCKTTKPTVSPTVSPTA